MGYINPLLDLPAGQALMALHPDQKRPIAHVLRALHSQANEKAEMSWKKRKGPMAAYWRAVSTYALHMARLLDHDATTVSPIAIALRARVAELEAENARLRGWLERIDGGDDPSDDASQLTSWAYAALIGHAVPE